MPLSWGIPLGTLQLTAFSSEAPVIQVEAAGATTPGHSRPTPAPTPTPAIQHNITIIMDKKRLLLDALGWGNRGMVGWGGVCEVVGVGGTSVTRLN